MKCRSAALLAVAALLPVAGARAAPPAHWKRVVINEVMVAPSKVDPAFGQWIELYNPGQDPVNLQNVVIETDSGQHVLSKSNELLIPPGGYLVLGRSADATLNGGVGVAYAYAGELLLDTESDTLRLRPQGSEFMDVITYGPSADLVVKVGASLSLEPFAAVEAATVWCHGRTLYGYAGDKGTPGAANTYCDGDGDGVAEDEGDCDDGDPAVHPGATEVCNGADDDCDGAIDEQPAGAPSCLSLGVCAGVEPACGGAAGFSCPYPKVFEPVEQSCDGLDNDCDGDTDEDLPPPPEPCLGKGVCQGTVPECSGAGGWVCPYPPAWHPEETCDGLDDDCDGETDEAFQVGAACEKGVGTCRRTGVRACAADGKTAPCSAVAGEPEAERCDSLDNDCDGLTDEDFVSGTRAPGGNCTTGAGACAANGKWRCSEDGTALVCAASPGLPGVETCDDKIDNDCDGWTDEADCEGGEAPEKTSCASAPAHGPGAGAAGVALLLSVAAMAVVRPRTRAATSGRASRTPAR
ncbi:MAG: lamin tail domain-containing protein [Deltaproteobacteria bacterium]|nr:lamin tail domain-containing protein [Deltaproteobacteria bacterium]